MVGLLALGCSSDASSSDTLSGPEPTEKVVESTTTVTSTTVEREQVTLPDEFASPQEEIIATYLLYGELLLIAAGRPEADPDYAPLYEVLAEPHESFIRDSLQGLKEDGHIELQTVDTGNHTVRFGRATKPITEQKVEGQEAFLVDCFYNVTEVHDLDGNVVDDEYETIAVAVVMKVVDGAWRVAGTDVKQIYEGKSTCDEWA